jgi:hypothetical protein
MFRYGAKVASFMNKSLPVRKLSTDFNYDVNVTVKKEIYPKFYQWIMETIQDKMLKLKGFQRADVCEVRVDPKSDTQELCVRYTVDIAENFEQYIKNDAAAIGAEAVKKFGEKNFSSKLSIYTSQVVLHSAPSDIDTPVVSNKFFK